MEYLRFSLLLYENFHKINFPLLSNCFPFSVKTWPEDPIILTNDLLRRINIVLTSKKNNYYIRYTKSQQKQTLNKVAEDSFPPNESIMKISNLKTRSEM